MVDKTQKGNNQCGIIIFYLVDNNDIHEIKERCYIYLSDEHGYVKVWDFTGLLKNIKKVPSYVSTKLNFTPKRKENINVSTIADVVRRE